MAFKLEYPPKTLPSCPKIVFESFQVFNPTILNFQCHDPDCRLQVQYQIMMTSIHRRLSNSNSQDVLITDNPGEEENQEFFLTDRWKDIGMSRG